MRPVFVDDAARSLALRSGMAALAGAAACAFLVTLFESLPLRLFAGAAVAACVLGGLAAVCLPIQQSLVGQPVRLSPAQVVRWSGALLGAVGGPLVTAQLLVMAIAAAGTWLVEAEGGGMFAGIGIAWLALPMALLVAGTGALKLPAIAARDPIDTAAAIALANGREWSLAPLGVALTIPFLLLSAGTLLAATGTPAGLLLVVPGALLFMPASAALARRWQRLHA